MESINASREVRATADKVWNVVSEVDRDPEYWDGMNSLHNIRKEGNVTERSVVVGFMGHTGLQKIELSPKSSIELTMSKGPMKGSRMMKLTPLEGGKKTRIDVSWNFQFSGVPVFARAFVKSQIERTTAEALKRIAKAAEGPSSVASRPSKRKAAS